MSSSQETFGEGSGNPLQYSCLENPMDGGAWWAAVHRVSQSQTWLKQLSMHACIGEGNGNPIQCSWLENPGDGGAWWAAVYGVAQGQTRLKRLGSSSSIVFYIQKNRVLNIQAMSSIPKSALWEDRFLFLSSKKILLFVFLKMMHLSHHFS